MTASPEPPAAPRRRVRKFVVRLFAVTVVSALLVEGFFRIALFHDGVVAATITERYPQLRAPQHYAWSKTPEYWKLQHLLLDEDARGREARYHPVLGWRNKYVDPETYEHEQESELGGRRPVLLFGDSFANCITPPEKCWEGLMERSRLSDRYKLLNYGAAGYGMDQISLLCQLTLPRFVDRDPIVAIAVLIDDDLDRAMLDFRVWPKPRFEIAEDGLRLDERELPRTRDAYVERDGVGITSYAWRYIVHGTTLYPLDRRTRRLEYESRLWALSTELIGDLVAYLDAAEVDWFFLVFHGEGFLKPNSLYSGRDRYLTAELERLGAPYVLSREALIADVEATGRGGGDYFIHKGRGKKHYTAVGNQVVFRALRDGVLGSYQRGAPPEAGEAGTEDE